MADKIRFGMVGGGPGGSIGKMHRHAARIDNKYELVCGAFSRDKNKSMQMQTELALAKDRIYASYQEMFAKESALPEAERMQVVSIVTPNYLHFEIAKAALESGFHIILEKPVTISLAQAKELQQIIAKTGQLCCVGFTNTGFPMVKEARAIIAAGKLGKVRKVYVEFLQGWLSTAQENKGNKQAEWRSVPEQSGLSGTMADIGSHAFNLAEYITGIRVTHLMAQVNTVVPGRQLDDDGCALLKFDNGATGVLTASQVAVGEEASLRIRIYGEKGSLQWQHDRPGELTVTYLAQPKMVLRAGLDNALLSQITLANGRTPAGSGEGPIGAYANHYRNFANAIKAGNNTVKDFDYPLIYEGARGMAFIETVIASSEKENWLMLSEV